MKRLSRAERADARAVRTIEENGWALIAVREGGIGRFVAEKTIREDDDSVTRMFESTYTLDGLAKQVTRRMREEGLA